MEDNKLRRIILKTLIDIRRDSELNPNDFFKHLQSVIGYFYQGTLPVSDNKSELFKKADISEATYNDFHIFWEKLVQDTINFVNTHDDLKQSMIKSSQAQSFQYGENDEFTHLPIGVFSFGFDDLLESAEAGQWVPASDSNISFSVGEDNILFGC